MMENIIVPLGNDRRVRNEQKMLFGGFLNYVCFMPGQEATEVSGV